MCTSDETVVTTTSITTVSGSMRSAHSECRSPKLMKEKKVTRASCPAKPTSKKAYQDKTHAITRKVEVTSSAISDPAADGSCSGCSAWLSVCAPCGASGDGAPCAWSSGTS